MRVSNLPDQGTRVASQSGENSARAAPSRAEMLDRRRDPENKEPHGMPSGPAPMGVMISVVSENLVAKVATFH